MNNLQARHAQFENILSKYAQQQGAGIAAIITQGGESIFCGAQGSANIAQHTPLTVNHVMRIGSLTKQMTAAAILLLHERRLLSLSADIHTYLPKFPSEHSITVANLLTHTAGLGNHTENPSFISSVSSPITSDALVALCAEIPKHAVPNEKLRYSNDGYILLGKIIEIVSGQSYAEFVAANLFEPIGMTDTEVGEERPIGYRATGYTRGEDGVTDAFPIDMGWPFAAGAVVSTVGDLAKWFHALSRGKVISAESFHTMTNGPTLKNGRQTSYGFGLETVHLYRHKAFQHGGGIPGFNAFGIYFPDEDLYIAALANNDTANTFIVCAYLAIEALDIPLPDLEQASVAPEILATWAGEYFCGPDRIAKIAVENGQPTFEPLDGFPRRLIPLSEGRFRFDGSVSHGAFETGPNGEQQLHIFPLLVEQAEVWIKKTS